MNRKDKLLERAKRSVSNFKYNDLIRLAMYHGFIEKRQKGSHLMMTHPDHDIFINFQNWHGKAKPYQVKQLIKAIEEHEL